MESAQKKAALGRGLDALFGEGGGSEEPIRSALDTGPSSGASRAEIREYQTVDLDLIEPNPDQPRKRFAEEELEELATSIRENGLVQPILARQSPHNPEMFEIVAGERRWRAAQKAGLHQAPIVVRELDDEKALAFAIIENVQRSDLNAMEEAQGYQQLIDRFAYTQDQMASVVGKSRPHIANMLRLNTLPDSIKDRLRAGELSAGHGRALVGVDGSEPLAKKAVDEAWSVRQLEKAVKGGSGKNGGSPFAPKKKDADTALLEGELSLALQAGVSIKDRGEHGGELVISYRTVEDRERLVSYFKNVQMPVMAGTD
ncbi:MAG: ParB/RepB/Spo0J family partition protein [Pseudomonadota bacterium]